MKLNLGIRGHDINKNDPNDIAEDIRQHNLGCMQLALKKSFPDLNINTGTFSPGFARHIAKTFHNKDIDITVLGCYINMIHPNTEEREKLLEYFKAHIRYAYLFGCPLVGSETGNINEKMGYTEDNFTEEAFRKVVKSVKELVKEAEKWGVVVAIEGGINHPIHTPEKLKRLIKEVDSSHLQVIFDPANFMTLENYKNQEDVFKRAFRLFGDQIVIVHAKDFVIEDNWIKMVPVGKGLLRYDLLFKWIKEVKPGIEVLLENTKEPYIKESIDYLHQEYEKV
ncbi:sugar phosphate isomerase/epimerase family protein [Saliterribacillus persicus]|uniref:Sugar phosphate isomerase/epimerase n=1 Tax=Saliterribacillus persicus TaxID=930114 RepID=A0A368YCY4_9BACI|nr:sugar phosphate isomerase/epimerase family protein [Saliterribacillus persicus]RCW76727.1 sugar phosphate isomerase/epimerase [Saliterribacillus persicus]